ncbi:hypothetical protein FB451DRAFT_1185488 [Mycena latifolia]|nr:hypothetical protein FB451DRAFT_1185488 [Mycena latifolia]
MAAPHNSFSPSIRDTPAACSFVALPGCDSASDLRLFSASTFCCMALNLQLVLVSGVNGNKMGMKYYTVVAPLLLARHRSDTRAASIEVISFVTILIFLVRYEHSNTTTQMRVRRLRDDNTTSQGSSFYQSSSDISTIASSRPQPPIVRYRHMIIRIVRNLVLTDYVRRSSHLFTCTLLTLRRNNLEFEAASIRHVRVVTPAILYAMLSSTDPSFVAAIRARRPKSDTTMIWRVQPLEPELESGDHDNKLTRRGGTRHRRRWPRRFVWRASGTRYRNSCCAIDLERVKRYGLDSDMSANGSALDWPRTHHCARTANEKGTVPSDVVTERRRASSAILQAYGPQRHEVNQINNQIIDNIMAAPRIHIVNLRVADNIVVAAC